MARAPGPTTLFSGYSVLCTNADGSIVGDRQGLFFRDARLLSRYRLTIGDQVPTLVSAGQPESDRWIGVLRLARAGGHADGPLLPQDALEIVIRREVGPGLIETIAVTNHSRVACRSTLRLEIDGDFVDVAELRSDREQRGETQRDVVPGTSLRLWCRMEAGDRTDERGLWASVVDAPGPATVSENGIAVDLDLGPRGTFEATIGYAVLDRGTWRRRSTPGSANPRARQRGAWRRRRPTIAGPDVLRGPFERAADDLFDLRNWELEADILGRDDGAAWVLNAGVPMFTGLFGRDVVTAGWQAALLGPRALAGALDAVAASQIAVDDPWRDAEPGKLIHEQRSGPLATLGLTPRDAYYGSQTTPAMFVLALSELWHWTGDDAVLRRHVDTARRAMDWARSSGDLDGDGFLEYQRRCPQGLRNQGWKDSDEAIRHTDGSIVDGPTATVEEQAFYILALERSAEILVALDDDDGAAACLDRAGVIRRRWHEAFWMADEGFYAMALDGQKRPVRSIGSNPGHALGAGVVPHTLARRVADRLLADDLFSGWGVRSLSTGHPSYNPFAYHLGAVWPVEQATFALGFKRYGLDEHLDRLADAVFAAAARSPDGRLPEALAGHAREAIAMPVPYPSANVPQAWSASALIQIVQVMLGLYPFAPLRTLAVVRPRLPAWAPQLTLRRLRVGQALVDIEFRRRADGSASWRVLRQTGSLLVVPAGPPDDVGRGSWFERAELAALDRAPGRLARAARIALGRSATTHPD